VDRRRDTDEEERNPRGHLLSPKGADRSGDHPPGTCQRLRASGLCGPVLADGACGTVTQFRRELDVLGMQWCLGIDSTLKVIDADEDLGEIGLRGTIGRPPIRPRTVVERSVESESVAEWAFKRQTAFRTVTWRQGSKGPMSSRFAVWRLRHAHRTSTGFGCFAVPPRIEHSLGSILDALPLADDDVPKLSPKPRDHLRWRERAACERF
jgi:hypothetical protein